MKDRKFELADTANLSSVYFNQAAGMVVIYPSEGLLPFVQDRARALNLAAWIVALVDPEGKEFPQLLDAVKKA